MTKTEREGHIWLTGLRVQIPSLKAYDCHPYKELVTPECQEEKTHHPLLFINTLVPRP